MSDDTNLSQDPEFKAWAAHVHAHVLPNLQTSALTVSLVPRGETDIKFAVELGLSIMLDKPIIAVVQRGVTVPGKLRQIADAIVEVDYDNMGAKDTREELQRTIEVVIADVERRREDE